MSSTASRYRPLALIFVISLVASIGLGVFGPRLLGLDSKPQWMLWTHLALGAVSVVTIPFAWRWLYRTDKTKRFALWLVLVAAVLAALWCCNLILFHLWASDVPPYAAEWHLRWAVYSAITLVAFLVVGIVCARRLLSGRSGAA